MRLHIILFFCIQLLKLTDAAVIANVENKELPVIEIVGSKFFDSSNGEQFYMKGIAYQPSRSIEMLESAVDTFETKYIDPLADPIICLRDIPYLKKLNINTIRVYTIDPTQSHDVCMQALSNEGIYVLLDLAEPDVSINRDTPTWDVNIWKRYCDVIDSMHQYSNLLGFFAGNEVTNDITNTDASPFVKAAIRDVKKYIQAKGYRSIPVGYSSNDDADTRDNLAEYFACGEYAADFYGINMYEWCGYSSYGTSGYKERTKEFEGYPIPVFFSEFGCNLIRPRPFTEVSALFGAKMSSVWSGGLAYMYFEEENEYGIVKVDEELGVTELEDFKYLQKEFGMASPKGVKKEDYINSNAFKKLQQLETCPQPQYMMNWHATNNIPPAPDVKKCSCLENVLPCLVLPFENAEKEKEYFNYVCGQVDCSDIKANGEYGEYGEFSSCSSNQKLALQISKLYNKLGKNVNECPISDRNVYFNIKSQRKSLQTGKCSDVTLQTIKNAIITKPKNIVQEPVKEEATKETPYRRTSGADNNSLTYSGCLLLVFSIFVMTLVL
ncbi:hypothetical protein Kpol_164p2 [Vanderwaltozyma polyspora DSM 70294]|uniref:1,3-beta-glucanosyltransferase n=1 Tax=Vanderwaltozyma polyspora (strain ATCC 22028 / DSM 70294 / BCRC 21397 / CBS 2163 / NBRC 10782 / NRRL Y-8283 / UCD 57-17) TaxID=436907 RepID=A7TTQ3_VANPO|nr:uncharacterized protein Kpol_164p2 [Vanderwaltozyma polyspora DSM 70294]EDO14355.1 hypothetical protein Kpol_164p2 [Vanderwaltozyma polyspora DSM 70294]